VGSIFNSNIEEESMIFTSPASGWAEPQTALYTHYQESRVARFEPPVSDLRIKRLPMALKMLPV